MWGFGGFRNQKWSCFCTASRYICFRSPCPASLSFRLIIFSSSPALPFPTTLICAFRFYAHLSFSAYHSPPYNSPPRGELVYFMTSQARTHGRDKDKHSLLLLLSWQFFFRFVFRYISLFYLEVKDICSNLMMSSWQFYLFVCFCQFIFPFFSVFFPFFLPFFFVLLPPLFCRSIFFLF